MGLWSVSSASESVAIRRVKWLYAKYYEKYGETLEEQFFNTRAPKTLHAANIQQIAGFKFQGWGKVPLVTVLLYIC